MRDLHETRLVDSLAFVIMPDHLHWLFALGEEPLHKVMQLLKARSGLQINRARSVHTPVWQRSFHDHALRSDESAGEMATYIVLNPVRAGLVREIGDYAFWDSIWL